VKTFFVLNWEYRKDIKAYLVKGSPNRKPYTSNPLDKDCHRWKTKEAAERFLKLKDKTWAGQCVIEKITVE